VKKTPTTCRNCWTEFHDGDQLSMTLADERVVSKNANGRWPKSVTIKALFARCQNPGECLTDFNRNFYSSVDVRSRNQLKHREGLVPAEIKMAMVDKKAGTSEKVFALTDNCTAIGAADVTPYFKGAPTERQHGVKGLNYQDAPMAIGQSQSGALLLTDDQGGDFIGRHGGGLKANPGQLNEIIWSVSQMLAAHDSSNRSVTERNSQLKVAGGRAVNCAVRDGLHGVEGELTSEKDPRWLELEHAWLSPEGEYRPPATMDPKQPLLSRKNLKVCVLGTTDNADPDELRNQVSKDMTDKDDLHAMSPFSHLEAMDLSTDDQVRILEARHGGLSFRTIGKGLSGKKTAMDVLSAKGWAKLEQLAATKFRHNGSCFKKHKQRTREPKGGKLQSYRYRRKPGDSLCTDSYSTGMASTPTF
jgi:hypothetical protein